MPVDPGNLMLVGRLAGIPVIGAPGCARSPSQNGFDWVLTRLIAGIAVARADVVRMGVGGLLKEIATRPQPRLIAETAVPSVAAVILAAGQSRRMGGPNKLLAPVAGTPVIRRVAEEAIAAGLAPVLVVTGHQQAEIAQALTGLAVRLVDNPDYREGIASSVRTGVAAVPEATQGALICLGDMPLADRGLFARMAAQFAPDHGALVVVPVKDGRRGNPVLWSRRFFPDLMQLSGDVGARHLLERYGDAVAEVEVADDGAFVDVDTPEALQAVQQRVPPGAQK